jgi:hypothetical protein
LLPSFPVFTVPVEYYVAETLGLGLDDLFLTRLAEFLFVIIIFTNKLKTTIEKESPLEFLNKN